MSRTQRLRPSASRNRRLEEHRHDRHRHRRAGRGDEEAGIQPPIGVHDPVRLDRHRRGPDLDHPGRQLRLQRGRLADPEHVPRGAPEPGREQLMIPILMVVFGLGGTTYGMAEESLAFYLLIVTVMIAAGYDALTGAALLLLGCGIGTLGSTINPFATGIASGFAGTSISVGLLARLVILIAGLVFGIWYVMRYAGRVKKDPDVSLVASEREANAEAFKGADVGGDTKLTGTHKVVLVLLFLAFVA